MLKILQVRLQQYVNWEYTDVKAGFRKGRGIRHQVANICWIIEKSKRIPEKTYTFASLMMLKPLTVMITTNSEKFWERREYQTTGPASWEIRMQIRKQQLKLDMEQQTGSKQEKECVKAIYCHPTYLTSMQSTSWETLDWKKHKLESRLPGERSITSYADDTTLRQKVKRN